MWRSSKARYDIATAIDRGSRPYQEDAVLADFPIGESYGIGLLADGMGGHKSGDLASAIVLSRAYSELKILGRSILSADHEVPKHLRAAINASNDALRSRMAETPGVRGMGSTLVAAAIVGPKLYWASVGDSPLYLFRDRALKRLNEDHSMAPQIEALVAAGQLKAEAAEAHPDRHCLTSAVYGSKIARIDCPVQPLDMSAGDVLVLSSDGLQTADDATIERIVSRHRKKPASEIAEALMDTVLGAGKDDQDNVSIMVIKILSDTPLAGTAPKKAAKTAGNTRLLTSDEVFDAVEMEEIPTDSGLSRAVGE